jgi:hypothetical protein
MTEWVTPPTFVNGPLTTEDMNKVRDDLLHLFESGGSLVFGAPYTIDPRIPSVASAMAVANHCHYQRVYGGGTITKIRIKVGTSNGNIGVAVYNNAGAGLAAAPNARQQTSGAIACPAAGASDVTLGAAVAVSHGDWFALSASGITATFHRAGNPSADFGNGLSAAQATAHPPPASAIPSAVIVYLAFQMIGVT